MVAGEWVEWGWMDAVGMVVGMVVAVLWVDATHVRGRLGWGESE